ncbi:MAG: methionyl-tRNA formyltransferase [Verrucomicrobiia bacterium]
MKTIFMGTAAFAVPSLEALINCHFIDLVAVVTQPDRAAGRSLKIQPSAVKQAALNYNIPILQPAKAKDESFLNQLAEIQPNLIVVAAYGQILPRAILDLPPFGCLNVHASLLPKYRGAAPIQWAIINGETETGVTIMKIDEGMDTGDILTQRSTPIDQEETAETLHNRLAQIGSELLIETIPPYIDGKIKPTPQDNSKATYAPKITKEHGHIDWSLPASAIFNRIRAFIPWPGAYTFLEEGDKKQMLKIWEAAIENKSGNQPGTILEVKKDSFTVCCGTGSIKVLAVQPENSRVMKTGEYLAGHKLNPGQVLK